MAGKTGAGLVARCPAHDDREPALRQYQADLVARIRACDAAGRRRVLAVTPTGAGKTVLFAYMTSRAPARGRRVLVLVHRVELVEAEPAPLYSRLRTMSYLALLAWADTREKLELAAVARGYKRGWIWHQLRDRAGAP